MSTFTKPIRDGQLQTDLDVNRKQLTNAVLENLAVAPVNPIEGMLYFDTVLKCPVIYQNGAWAMIGAVTTLTPRSSLTGGAAGALDAIVTEATVTTGDIAYAVVAGVFSIWQLRAGTDAEDSAAGIVRPDDYDGVDNPRIWVQIS